MNQKQESHNKKVESLETKLKNTKIFLNMVIHDMRNPTASIEFAVKEVLNMLEVQRRTSKFSCGLIAPGNQMINVIKHLKTNPFSV
jgi:hypothetical protein